MKFKDLEFKVREYGSVGDICYSKGGVGAQHTFDNGITISVQASKINYSTPKENLPSADDFSLFEVALWDKDGEWVTKEFFPDHNDDVAGWQSRKNINNLIEKLS